MLLDAPNKSLEITVNAAATTSESHFVVEYTDIPFAPGASDGVTTGTTIATLVAAPTSGVQRQVKNFTVFNADTVTHTYTLKYNNSGTRRTLPPITLLTLESILYAHGELYVLDVNGAKKLAFGPVNLATGVVGVLAIANGGTAGATAADARTNLGLGTAATKNTGTSGNTVPLLDGANSWSETQTVAGRVLVDATSLFGWSTTRSLMRSPADGNITMLNQAENDFGLLQFGGTSSSFCAFKANGAELEVRLADDSASTALLMTKCRLRDTGGDDALELVAGSNLSANRTMTFTTGDASRTITLGSNLEKSAAALLMDMPVRLMGYTVATLPAGAAGDIAYVTNALGPAFGAAVVGGGGVTVTVFYNGAAWIVA